MARLPEFLPKRSPLLSRGHLPTWLGCINEAIETRRRGSSTRAARCSASPTAIRSSRSLCRLSCTAIARSVTAAAASVSTWPASTASKAMAPGRPLGVALRQVVEDMLCGQDRDQGIEKIGCMVPVPAAWAARG